MRGSHCVKVRVLARLPWHFHHLLCFLFKKNYNGWGDHEHPTTVPATPLVSSVQKPCTMHPSCHLFKESSPQDCFCFPFLLSLKPPRNLFPALLPYSSQPSPCFPVASFFEYDPSVKYWFIFSVRFAWNVPMPFFFFPSLSFLPSFLHLGVLGLSSFFFLF